ncbi:uncharacterized mitochondrial protein AtMg00810-like [Solanum tuberosum]|uniref:uncharacterized mitochondrial protein AtMg00810-like n=1 Tax=Solanum tuberosum TaxID=4113 RepID=UPI00073A527A|nr:PREDICTED: uncharacterized mitochondrial protein AtMg00810-like [Solanum tuberosum]
MGYLSSIGFVKTKLDASLLIRHAVGDSLFDLVYVDEIIITGSNTLSVNYVITSFASKFSIKDLGNLHFFLGVEVIRNSNGLILTQANYVNKILNDELMTDHKSVNTPMSASKLLTFSDGTHLTDVTRYLRVLGRLQYLSFTRPGIAYAVNKLTQFMQAPSDLHWKAIEVGTSLTSFLHLVTSCFLVTIRLAGPQRSKILSQAPPLSLNTGLWLMHFLKPYGSPIS